MLCSLLMGAGAFAAGLDAQLDRARLVEGDTLVLTLSAAGGGSETLDLSPLQEDFDLLDQNQSSRMSIINGESSSSRVWQLLLAPKRTGKLTIPSLRLGEMTSPALSLEVIPAAQAAKMGEPRPLLLEVEATPQDAYVQSQMVYTLRVLSRVKLYNASLTVPKISDAIVESLGEDKEYKTFRNGQQYQVIERRYAIFPQHSGKLEIDAPVLSAQVSESSQQRQDLNQRLFGTTSPFYRMNGMLQRLRPMQLRGRSLSLEVLPQPANTLTPWLPAKSLKMTESWSPNPPVFKVGKSVTRTITISARGLSGAQLPDLNLVTPDGIKSYPDKWQSEQQVDDDTLVVSKTSKIVLLPSSSGHLTLPEVRIDWWDIQANRQRMATLPARKIQVLPGKNSADKTQISAPVDASASQSADPDNSRLEIPPATDAAAATDGLARLIQGLIDRIFTAGYWPWISTLLALGWLITTGLWLRDRARVATGESGTHTPAAWEPALQPEKILPRLERACKENNAKAARHTLLEWASARWPDNPPRRLEALGYRLDAEAAKLLRALDQALYAPMAQKWEGNAFWKRLSPSLKESARRETARIPDGALPELYPQTG
jgi:hypothetical protein